MAPDITALGIAHTAISSAAIGCAAAAFIRGGRIQLGTGVGTAYVGLTALAAITALGIHQRAAWGPGHVLAVLTLLAIALALVAARSHSITAARMQTVALSATLLFHAIPGTTEALTRLPIGAPLVDTPDSPVIKGISGALLAVFLVAAFFQARRTKG